MLTTLMHAPIGVPLTVASISDEHFASRISRLGLYEGASIMRLNESVAIGPVKVKGPKGEAILSGWFAAQIVMHRDDDQRIPLLECKSGDSGHIEGLTGNDTVEKALSALGLQENDKISFIRRVPPMSYKVLVDDTYKVQINEGLACKLVGETPEGRRQFSSVGVGEPFVVQEILLTQTPKKTFSSLHIHVGSNLSLLRVSVSQLLNAHEKDPVICVTKEGTRLFFHEKDALDLIVNVEGAEAEK